MNTYLGGSDRLTGRLVSPPFKITRRYISFLLGGGNHPGKTCINLIVDGAIVRTATGKNNERLEWHNWNVAELEGKDARIEIVDQETGGWGHINIDQIELRDSPRPELAGPLAAQRDFGSMALALLEALDPSVRVCLDLGKRELDSPEDRTRLQQAKADQPAVARGYPAPLVGAVGKEVVLAPGEHVRLRFAVTWCFPNLYERGQRRGELCQPIWQCDGCRPVCGPELRSARRTDSPVACHVV